MSNESSASETTPLRRPESQNSEYNVTTSSATCSGVDNNRGVATKRIYNNNANNNNCLGSSSGLNTAAVATTVTINKHNRNKRNSNNIVEVSLSHNTINHTNNNNNSHNNLSNSLTIMDTNKRILYRVGLDVLILICVGAPILGFFLWGDSYKRGFFCDDESLKHPFKPSTVKSWMLYIIGLVIPVGMIIAVELVISKHNAATSNGNSTARRYAFMGFEIPDWLIECYKKIGVFGFGAAVGQLTTDIAKYSIGRLRPHFFTVCQPVLSDGSTCEDPINFGRYIQEFTCRGVGSTARMLKEVRLSFPSGHSSFTFYTMVYLALYLQARMKWRGSKLLRHFLQFIFIMIAWYTALSRVSDYKHHWSDVLAGSTIGALVAVIVAKYVSDLFEQKVTKSYMLPRTTQDIPSQTTSTNGY